jgi:hypothetical protein
MAQARNRMSAVTKYLSAIGAKGGKAGKGSAAKAASAKKANAARWKWHRKTERVPAKPNDQAQQ